MHIIICCYSFTKHTFISLPFLIPLTNNKIIKMNNKKLLPRKIEEKLKNNKEIHSNNKIKNKQNYNAKRQE